MSAPAVPATSTSSPPYGGVNAADLLGGGKGLGAPNAGVAKPAAGGVEGGIGGFLQRIAHVRERLNLPSPGSFENLHREVRGGRMQSFFPERS